MFTDDADLLFMRSGLDTLLLPELDLNTPILAFRAWLTC